MVRFSLPASMLIAVTVCLALGGCTAGTTDEYRTFEEVQAEKLRRDAEQAQHAERSEEKSAGGERPEISQRKTGPAQLVNEDGQAESTGRAASQGSHAGDTPEEPLLTQDEVEAGNNVPPVAGSGQSTQTAPLRAAVNAADSSASEERATDDSVAAANPPSNRGSEGDRVRAGADVGDRAVADADSVSRSVAPRPQQGASADSSPALSTPVREIKLLVPEKTFHTEGPEGALRVSYDDLNLLTILNMEPVPPNPEPYFPDWLRALEGRRIRIRGFMYPAFVETGLQGFILVRDNQECCFGPGAKIYDHIEVAMRNGVTTDYIPGRPFDVVGRFHIRPEADDEELYQLYQIDDAIVIE